MIIRLLAIGERMPAWVDAGYQEYAKRFIEPWRLQLVEIPAEKRSKNSDMPRLMQREGERLLAATRRDAHLVVLDVRGKTFTTEALAKQLEMLQSEGAALDLLIGGPDGLSANCLARAHARWSLSALTLPHPLVRILLAEQLYRATTILRQHPYHRGN